MLNNTKKFLSTVIAAILTCSTFAATAAADGSNTVEDGYCNEIHEEHIDDYELELINSGRITNESIAEFNAYIASLDDESAAIILDDSELVLTMKMTTYWHPNDDNEGIATYAYGTLPLREFPAGSYFTYDGDACTCHGPYNTNCTYTIPTGFSRDRCYNLTTRASGNCIRYDPNGSIQCMGFADYVFKQYNGVNRSSSNVVTPRLTSITSTSVKNYFKSNLKVGSHFRFNIKNSAGENAGPHSIIITGITDNGITYYQANYGGKCLVSTGEKTWAQLSNWIYDVINSWTV